MNIWFFSPNGQPRGPRSRVYNYALRLIKFGHQVTIFTKSHYHGTAHDHLGNNENVRVEVIDGITTVWVKTMHYRTNGLKRLLSEVQFGLGATRAARDFDSSPDVVVADSVTPINGAFGVRVANARHAAFVHQIRDVWPIALVGDKSIKKNSLVYYSFRAIEKFLYRRADWVCTSLPMVHQHIENSGGDSRRVTYVRNGADLDQFSGFKPYAGGGSVFKAVYVGTIAHAHDVITIVKAAAMFEKEGDRRFQFLIYGDGVKKAECVSEASKEGLMNLTFKGMVDKKDVPEILADADILIASVLKSDAYEFGMNLNKLYDYFAAGRPVIFSGSAPNDDVKEANAGYSIDPESPSAMRDALKEFLDLSVRERKLMAANAREFAQQEYDIDVLALRFEKMLLRAIESKGTKQ
jgi:glycosyltransferase involved in cell wall biosynthesis